MTYAVYAYRPISITALRRLVEREVLGQQARYERFAAEMLYMIAAGTKIDPHRAERFGKQVDAAFKNPFTKREKPMTAAEIKQHLIDRIDEHLARREHDGLNDAGSENHAG